MSADWPALCQEWVNHPAMSLKELADAHKLNESTVRNRAKREKWQEQRDEVRRIATERATEAVIDTRAEQLAKMNEDDLRLSRALKGKAAQMMNSGLRPIELRAIASTIDMAQKIARLALGAETAHTINSNRQLPSSVDDFV